VRDRHVCKPEEGDTPLWVYCLCSLVVPYGVLMLTSSIFPQKVETPNSKLNKEVIITPFGYDEAYFISSIVFSPSDPRI
jgi:hypothetical protein